MKNSGNKFNKNIRKVMALFLAVCCVIGAVNPYHMLDCVFDGMGIRTFAASGVDRTNDTDELEISIEQFGVLKNGTQISNLTETETETEHIYDAGKNGFYDISGIKMQLYFTVKKKPSEGRQIHEGDYVIYKIPDGFVGKGETAGQISDTVSGKVIANYTANDGTLKITFTDAVNAEEGFNKVAGGLYFEMTMNHKQLVGKEKVVQVLPAYGSNKAVVLKLPEEAKKVDGIQETATYNDADNTIDWEITLGTNSTNVNLAGLKIQDTLGEGQIFTGVDVAVHGYEDTTGSAQFDAATGMISIDGAVKAPATVKVHSAITKDKLDEMAAQSRLERTKVSEEFSNGVQMLESDAVELGENSQTTADTTVWFGTSLVKNGVQVDSNTIHWTIVVNEENTHVYRGVVQDILEEGFSYIDGSLKYGAVQADQTPAIHASDWTDNSISYDMASRTLKFYMKQDTKDKYVIEFDTSIDGSVIKDEVTNAATVSAEFPYWENGVHYAPWDYGIPGINVHIDTNMVQKTVEANHATGILTWTIHPSSRVTSYENAVIEDVIASDQEYVQNSVTVTKNADGTVVPFGTYEDSNKTLTVTIPFADGKPQDYTITYQTKALNYFHENNVAHAYNNTAKLIVDGADNGVGKARISMTNPFFGMSSSFMRDTDGTSMFHYTITVNKNKLSVNHLVLEDPLTNCIFKDETGHFLPLEYWQFDESKGTVRSDSGAAVPVIQYQEEAVDGKTYKKALVDFGSVSDSYVVDLYVKLTEAGKRALLDMSGAQDSLANKKIYSENTAKVKSDEVKPQNTEWFEKKAANANSYMDNQLVKKTVSKVETQRANITWRVVINPNGGNMGTVDITDTIPKTQKYVDGTVELYEANYINGKIEKGTHSSKQFDSFRYDFDTEKRYFYAKLSDVTKTYILEYQTAVLDMKVSPVENNIKVAAEDIEYARETGSYEIKGSNWGTLESVGGLIVKAYDATVENDVNKPLVPVKDAVYRLYKDEECTIPVDEGKTDENGNIRFLGVDVPATGPKQVTYWLKETKTPEGYIIEDNDNKTPVVITRGVDTTATPMGNRRTEATGSTNSVTIQKKYRYTDENNVSREENDYVSSFALYFYPYGADNKQTKRRVYLQKTADGVYRYSNSDAADSIKTVNNSTDGITFNGLPWGYYGLEETKTADGFALYTGKIEFEITNDMHGSFGIKYYISDDESDNVIINKATEIYVKKLLMGTSDYISGAKLQICKKEADGSLVVVHDPRTSQAYEWTTVEQEAADGHKVNNLPAGTYVLHEVADGTDRQYKIAEDVPFTVNPNGTVKQGKNGQRVKAVTMYDEKISLQVKKSDQYGAAVAGAELTLTGMDGYTSAKTTTEAANGNIVTYENLLRGSEYVLTETVTPTGYQTAKPITVSVDEKGVISAVSEGKTIELVNGVLGMEDHKYMVSLNVQKKSAYTDEPLTGAMFELYRVTDDHAAEKLTDAVITAVQDDDFTGWRIASLDDTVQNIYTGQALNKGLGTGTYYLVETQAPFGYKLAENRRQYTFSVDNNGELKTQDADVSIEGTTVTVKDMPLTLRILPYEEGKTEILTGAEYEVTGIFAEDTHEKTVTIAETDSIQKENALRGKLVAGNVYKIEETTAPTGFVAAETTYIKLDSSGKVTLTDETGTEITQARTDVKNSQATTGYDGEVDLYHKPMEIAVKKFLKGTNTYLSGVTLQICTVKSDGTLEIVKNPTNNAAYEWITTDAEASDGHKVVYLVAGDYVLHEVSQGTDKKYKIAEDVPFTVKEDSSVEQAGTKVDSVVMYNENIQIGVKKTDQFAVAVTGAEFTLSGNDNDYKEVLTTNETGSALIFTNLNRDCVYTLEETKVPYGYRKAAKTVIRVDEKGVVSAFTDGEEMTITDGVITVQNHKNLVAVNIQKKAADTQEILTDAVFSLYRKAQQEGEHDTLLAENITMHQLTEAFTGWSISSLEESLVNTSTNRALKEGLGTGKYYLTETKEPVGYKKISAPLAFSVDENEMLVSESDYITIEDKTIIVTDEPLTLRILPFEAGKTEVLSGATYKITGLFAKDSEEKSITIAETDSIQKENALRGKLVAGNVYKVEEITAPAGFIAPKEAYVKVTNDGVVTLVDALGTVLDTREDAKTTNTAGISGYDGELDLYHERTHMDIVKRSDIDNRPLKDVTFMVTGMFADTQDESRSFVTDDDGRIHMKGVLVDGNSYTLEEKSLPGYVPLKEQITFTYDSQEGITLVENTNVGVTAYNTADEKSTYQEPTLEIVNYSAQNTTLQLIKSDAKDDSGLAGTVFTLDYTSVDNQTTWTKEVVTDAAGKVYSYETAGQEKTKTTVDGELFLKGLLAGTYTLTEKTVPYGYELGDNPFSCQFTVDENTKNTTIVINRTNAENHAWNLNVTSGIELLTAKGLSNNRVSGTVELVKTDSADLEQKLNGVTFAIYRYKESNSMFEYIRNLITGKAYKVSEAAWTEQAASDGVLKITGLEWGKYYIAETKALDNYVLDDKKYSFEIGKDQQTQVLNWTPGKTITNARVQLTIQQLTTTKNVTIGNEMRLEGNFLDENVKTLQWKVTEKPYVVAGMLKSGEVYTLEEISKQPYHGYVIGQRIQFSYKENNEIEFVETPAGVTMEIDNDGNIAIVQEIPPTKVSIAVYNENKSALPGAKLVLEQVKEGQKPEVIKTWTSEEEPKTMIGELLAGDTYIVREEEAPKDYKLVEPVTFTVEETPDWQYVELVHEKVLPTEPPTKPSETKSQAEPTKPNETKSQAEPTKPSETKSQAEPIKPSETKSQAEPTKPSETKSQAEPTKPSKTKSQAEPTKPSETKSQAEPIKPSETKSQTEPTKPDEIELTTGSNRIELKPSVPPIQTIEVTTDTEIETQNVLPDTHREENGVFYLTGISMMAFGCVLLVIGRRQRKRNK